MGLGLTGFGQIIVTNQKHAHPHSFLKRVCLPTFGALGARKRHLHHSIIPLWSCFGLRGGVRGCVQSMRMIWGPWLLSYMGITNSLLCFRVYIWLALFGWHGLREGLPMLLDSVYILKTKPPHPTPQALHKPQTHCKRKTPQIVPEPPL